MLSNLCFLTHDSPTPCQQLCKVDRTKIIALILLPRKRRHRDLVLRVCQLRRGTVRKWKSPAVKVTGTYSQFPAEALSSLGSTHGLLWRQVVGEFCLGQQRLAWTEVFQFNKSRVWEKSPGGSPWILAGGRKATRGEKDRRDVGGEGK